MPTAISLGDLNGWPLWVGDFAGAGRDGVLHYSPVDDRWWLGMFQQAGIVEPSPFKWQNITTTGAALGHAINNGHLFWQGPFTRAQGDEILIYNATTYDWVIGRWNDAGEKFEWIKAGNRPLDDGLIFWVGNFNDDAAKRDSLLFVNPADGKWTIASWTSTTLTFRFAGMRANAGSRFWVGKFRQGTHDELLAHSGDGEKWEIGSWNGIELAWHSAGETTTLGSVDDGRPFLVGNFNDDPAKRDGILFYYPGDGNWWLGTWNGAQLAWRLVANTAGKYLSWSFPVVSPRFWTVVGSKVLVYDGNSGWDLAEASGTNLAFRALGTSDFGVLSDGRPLFVGDFQGSGMPQVMFYYWADGNWWLGSEMLRTLKWELITNTGAVPPTDDGGFFGDVVSFVSTVYDAAATVVSPIAAVVEFIEELPIIGPVISLVVAAVQTVVSWSVSVVDIVLMMFGIYVPKQMRVSIIVQLDELGQPFLPPPGSELSVEGFLADAIAYMVSVYKTEAHVNVIPADETFIHILGGGSSPTLDVRCKGWGWVEDFGAPGQSFRRFMEKIGSASSNGRRLIGYGAPVIAFAVRSFTDGNEGCSLGPLQDYVTVDFSKPASYSKPASVLAHELGHACGLLHDEDSPVTLLQMPISGFNTEAAKPTLMKKYSDGRPATLTDWQVAWVRISRHVSFF